MGVGFDRIGVRQLAKPGECHPVFLNLNGKVTNTERLLNQAALGIQQFSEVANRRFVQRNLHCKPHSFALWLSVGDFGFFLGELFLAILRLAFKACGGDGFKYLLDLLAVSAVVKQERPVLGDREVVDLIIAGGHEFVFRPGARGIRNDLDQFLALCACHIVFDFHVRKPPLFLVVTYSL